MQQIRACRYSRLETCMGSAWVWWAWKAKASFSATAWQLWYWRNSNLPTRIFISFKLHFFCGSFPLATQELCGTEDASVLAWLGLSLENGCLHQKSFFCRNLFMSFALCPHFPLYHCKCQSRLEVSAQINSPCRKMLFFLSFFPSQVLIQPPFLLKSADSFLFHFKFPKHWLKCTLSYTPLQLSLLIWL